MRTFLLSLAVVLASLGATQSARVPYLTWVNDLDELSPEDFLEKQEQAPPPVGLNCSLCTASSEESCTASQETIQCDPGFVCFTQEAFDSSSNTVNFSRGCFPENFCDLACSILNSTGTIQSCMTDCCNTSLCNAGSPPTTEAPTTTESPATTMAPTPTTPPVCGGALNGSRGMFSSPNFPNNYPNNASCNFTITPSNGTLLRIAFRFFQLQFCRDFVEIFIDGRLVRTLTGNGRFVRNRGKRSLEDKRFFFRRLSCRYYGDEEDEPHYDDGDQYDDYDAEKYNNDGDAEKYYHDDEGEDDIGRYDDDDGDGDDDDYDDYDDNGANYEDDGEPEDGEYLGEADGWGRRRRPGWGRRRPGWGRRRPGWGRRRPGWGRRRPGWRRRPRRPVVLIRGGRQVSIVFTSDSSGTRRGFKAEFRVFSLRG